MLTGNYFWVYDLIVLVYAASVILYFYDFLQSNKKVNRIAFGLLIVVWLFQTIFFLLRMKELEYLPIMTMFETLFFYSWILVTLSLFINYFYKIDLLVFLANAVGFSIVVLNMFIGMDVKTGVNEALHGDLLNIHISFAIGSYVVFFLSFLFSVLYLLQVRMLKNKKIFSNLFKKIPPLDKLDRFSYLLALIAFPILCLSLVLGSIWAYINGIPIWTDVKFVVSFLILIVYGIYLHRRVALGWQGRKLAILNIIGFAFIIANYLLSKWISSFHNWV
jgi:HemX protein